MLTQWLIPILVFLSVLALGAAAAIVMAGRRRSLRARLTAPGQTMAAPEPAVVRAARRVGSAATLGTVSQRLREQLARAGYYRPSAATTYLGLKVILLIGGAVAGVAGVAATDLPMGLKAYLVAMAAAAAFFAPNVIVRLIRARRLREIRNHLPDAVDMLEICVTAGMGLDAAWAAVGEEVRGVSPTLADEMTLVDLEVQLGTSRTEAMRNMSRRTGADELGSLVALLVQSDRFGTSVAEALRVFAASSREARSARAEMAAEQLAVKLVFPMILFVFPAMLIVMVGPAGMALYRVLATG